MSSFAQSESESLNDSEIKEDFLEVDPKIPGQNFVCLSFVSPEKVLVKEGGIVVLAEGGEITNSCAYIKKDVDLIPLKGEETKEYILFN